MRKQRNDQNRRRQREAGCGLPKIPFLNTHWLIERINSHPQNLCYSTLFTLRNKSVRYVRCT